ncbi:MAG: hypothetical protein L6Q99_06265 [Planctomycetes bacterium]|nr:hypothetical protein [Planctomycetota bacterium]
MGTKPDSVSHHKVSLWGTEANGLRADVEVTLETFDRISAHVRTGAPLGDAQGVMASPVLGIDGEIPYGAPVRIRVFVECDDHPMYEFQRIEVV